jgi:hypothetical protein
MNDTGRMLFVLHTSREEDWRRADAWRRLHARPDVLPLPAVEPRPRRSFAAIFRPLAAILRMLPRQA